MILRAKNKILIAATILLLLIAYGLVQSWGYIRGPKITLFNSYEDLLHTSSTTIELTGKAERISYLYLNDRPIFVDKEGIFREKLVLFEGLNILTLRSKDRFGREIIKKIELVRPS